MERENWKKILSAETSRRGFLKWGAGLAGATFLDTLWVKKASARPLDFMGDPQREMSPPLPDYLSLIEPERALLEPLVKNYDLLDGLKKLTPEQRLEDFRMYFPIYKAAEIKYGISWFLLWIIHAPETADSRDPYPDWGPLKGPVQRNVDFHPDRETQEAAEGWEFLHDLPQRYSPNNGKDSKPYFDSDEILWAASQIREYTLRLQDLDSQLDIEGCFFRSLKQYWPSLLEEKKKAYQNIKRLLIKNSLYSDPFQPAQVCAAV